MLDRAKLREAAGNSYGVAERKYERLIGPFRLHGGEDGEDGLAPDGTSPAGGPDA